MSTENDVGSRPVPEAEAELEVFRQQWREEVSARSRRSDLASRIHEKRLERLKGAPPPAHATASSYTSKSKEHYNEEVEPKSYHDLPDKEDELKLGDGQNHDRSSVFKEPNSALEHYEKAVEKETEGNLGESMRHYRTAFKLDDGVHEAYKRKHFPPSAFVNPKSATVNPPNAAASAPRIDQHPLGPDTLPATIKQLVDGFSDLRIEAIEPETSLSKQESCFLGELPEEILIQILTTLAIDDVASFARVAQVCKRLAYLVLTEESLWKRVALGSKFGFDAMLFDYAVDISGIPTSADSALPRHLEFSNYENGSIEALPTAEEREASFDALTVSLLETTYNSSWRQLFRSRPRLRFNGCYISTVNYTRAGAASSNTLTWGAPVHVVTYFRYLRFFRDGSCISLLTTAEPVDVVHHLTKENMHSHHGSFLPSSVMKDALRGKWRLSGPASTSKVVGASGDLLDEVEGDVFVETEGAVQKYTYKMHLALAHAGKGTRNNKLAWKGFYSHNKLTDDWGEFGLRNDKAFYWSRVRSYGMGY